MPSRPSTERHEFKVDGFDYVLVLSETGNVALALTDGHIANRGWLSTLYRERDPFEKWEDYEPGVELLDDIDIGINAFRLMREVRGRINGWINRTRPSYFIISPNTERKALIYARISALLARRIRGYHCQPIGQSFYFFRLANSSTDELTGNDTAERCGS
jgi:hypothetical protein